MKEDLFFLGVKGIIRNDQGKILLLKVNSEKFRDARLVYRDMPGGRVDYGKSVEETLKREVEEEIGIANIRMGNSLGMILSPMRIPIDEKDYGLILSVYEVNLLEQAKIILSDEHIDYERFDRDEALRLLEIKYPKAFLEEMREKL